MAKSAVSIRRRHLGAVALAWWALPPAPTAAQPSFPGTEAGARALLSQFLPGSSANTSAAMKRLRPTAADYRAVYQEPLAARLEEAHKPLWESGEVIRGKSDQTELTLVFAKTDDLMDGQPVLREFPGGYSKVVDKMRRGVPIVRFKFTRPGNTQGMAFEGLVYVNGRWLFMPRPWRALDAG